MSTCLVRKRNTNDKPSTNVGDKNSTTNEVCDSWRRLLSGFVVQPMKKHWNSFHNDICRNTHPSNNSLLLTQNYLDLHRLKSLKIDLPFK